MDFKHIVSIILLINHSKGMYYLSEPSSNPSNAECKLATLPLTFDKDNIKTSIDMEINDSVWIGYFQALTALEYTGCAKISDLTFLNISTPFSAYEDPGSCVYFCKPYFGISIDQCYCLYNYTEILWLTEDECKKNCRNKNGFACGGSNYISIYKVSSANVTTEGCALFEPTTRKFDWHITCTRAGYRVLCYNRTTVYSPDGVAGADWMNAAKTCFNSGGRPSTFENSNKTELTRVSQLWTGMISSMSIFRFSEEHGTVGRPGILKKVDEDLIVLFPDGNSSVMLRALCLSEQAMNGTTRANNDSAVSSSLLSHETSTLNKISTTFELTRSSAINNDNGLPQERKRSADVGVPVGVSVAVVVIIVIAMTVLVVVKRRRQKTPNNGTKIEINNTLDGVPNEYNDIPEFKHINGNSPLRYSKVEEQVNYDHTYHVLEGDRKTYSETNNKIKKTPLTESDYNYPDMNGFVQEKAKSQSSDLENGHDAHTYFVLEKNQKNVDTVDGTYDVTGAHKPKTDLDTDNVYNKLENKNLATYDQIPGSAGSGKKYSSKKNPTKMLNPNEEPDSVYNHVSAVEKNDTYDHANIVSTIDKSP